MRDVKFYSIKGEIRILGIDDAPFTKKSKKTILIGTVFRGGKWLDGVLKTEVEVDGSDATRKIINLVNKSRHKDQLRVIVLDGITFGGFNTVDIERVFERTGLPVIIVNRKYPDFDGIRKALLNFKDFKKRWKLIEKAGEVYRIPIRGKILYIQMMGISKKDAEKIIKLSCTRSFYPEAIRVSHLIASAIATGESHGRA